MPAVVLFVVFVHNAHRRERLVVKKIMHLSAAGVPEAGNVLVYTKETLIKTSYRD